MSRTDGGPAFPRPAFEGSTTRLQSLNSQDGMSLRDYFAAHAMHNLRMNEPAYEWTRMAEQAYRYADAMIAERSKP